MSNSTMMAAPESDKPAAQGWPYHDAEAGVCSTPGLEPACSSLWILVLARCVDRAWSPLRASTRSRVCDSSQTRAGSAHTHTSQTGTPHTHTDPNEKSPIDATTAPPQMLNAGAPDVQRFELGTIKLIMHLRSGVQVGLDVLGHSWWQGERRAWCRAARRTSGAATGRAARLQLLPRLWNG